MNLDDIALSVRKDVVRMVGNARSGYVASALSVLDILVYLYEREMSANPSGSDRDRLVMGKGHGCPALYAVLAHRGFFDREALWNFRKLGALLQGRPDGARTPGVDASAGSPGLALGIANGIAMAHRMDGLKGRVFCVIGDGELQEGALWESAMTSSYRKLGSVVLVVDQNGDQMAGPVSSVKAVEPLGDKFTSFGWRVSRCDGHDFNSMAQAFSSCGDGDVPSVVIAKTKRGKGISFFEDHQERDLSMSRIEAERALEELDDAGELNG
ncbi:transketolase [Dethiosulfovibrio salsuginis]|uniref:Transketolase n=1 Tax=Dethiosulfovibrio salsuginis TaxID=561720 RepID=A0A1X7K5Z0_9BACT|nr:transketolase [Dethiosulfovibrio salsuginis]SMG36197.1 transketolase [Dethiosulfovibrio salsuginis]